MSMVDTSFRSWSSVNSRQYSSWLISFLSRTLSPSWLLLSEAKVERCFSVPRLQFLSGMVIVLSGRSTGWIAGLGKTLLLTLAKYKDPKPVQSCANLLLHPKREIGQTRPCGSWGLSFYLPQWLWVVTGHITATTSSTLSTMSTACKIRPGRKPVSINTAPTAGTRLPRKSSSGASRLELLRWVALGLADTVDQNVT